MEADDDNFLGKIKVVIKVLVGLAQQLTSTGYLTPIDGPKPLLQKITIADFMTRGGQEIEVSFSFPSPQDRELTR